MNATLAAGLSLAGDGLHIFPCQPGRKTPATRHGLLDATRDPEQIRAWWERTPTANLAVACEPSRLGVVDLDGREGIDAWRRLTSEQPTTRTLTVRTPSGGAHLWYTDHDNRLRSTSRQVAPGIDTRGRGGYVLVPPSVVGGRPYRWCTPPRFDQLPPVPVWVLERLRPVERTTPMPRRPGPPRGRYAQRAVENEVLAIINTTVGTRNATLNRSAFNLGQLVGAGILDHDDAAAALTAAGEAAGLPPGEVARTVASGLTAGCDRPRTVAVVA